MLVRANYILLPWDPSCLEDQPINWSENSSRSSPTYINEHYPSDGDTSEQQQITPDRHSTARSANKLFKICEYGSVTIASVSQHLEVTHDDDYKNDLVSAIVSLSEEEEEEDGDDNSTIVKSDVVLDNNATAPHDMKLLHTNIDKHQQDSSISVKDIYYTSSDMTNTVLLNHSIPTYYKTDNYATIPTIKTTDDSNVIFYKRREDFYPQITKQQQQQQQQQKLLLDQQTPAFSATNSIQQQQQNKRSSSIHDALGKAATRVYPSSLHSGSVNENGSGMPVFIPAASDKIKSKTVFKRLKTLVAKNKKRISTL